MNQAQSAPCRRPRVAWPTILNGFVPLRRIPEHHAGRKAAFRDRELAGRARGQHRAHRPLQEQDQSCRAPGARGDQPDLSRLELWHEARSAYAQLVSSHSNYEIAETFSNSIYCRIQEHSPIHDRYIFVKPSRALEDKPLPDYGIYVRYAMAGGLVDLVSRILDDFAFTVPWEDKRRDVIVHREPAAGAVAARARLPPERGFAWRCWSRCSTATRAPTSSGGSPAGGVMPLVLPCVNAEKGGIVVDAVLLTEDDASIVFSFTRSYFHVDADHPALRSIPKSIMPQSASRSCTSPSATTSTARPSCTATCSRTWPLRRTVR